MLAVAVAASASARARAADPETRPASRPTEPGDYVQHLARAMEEGLPAARYEAARSLIAINTPASRAAIAAALTSQDDRTQVAAAHAASEATSIDSMDSTWIPPLIRLLPRDRTTAQYAARALSHFDDQAPAYQALIETAKSKLPGQIAAVDALGGIVQKRVAETLVNLVNDPAATSDLRDAAIKSLVHLSGQTARPDARDTWTRWWTARSKIPDDAWRNQVLSEQHQLLELRGENAARQLAALRTQLFKFLKIQYDAQPAGQKKSDVLLDFLNDPDPDTRAAGARIVLEAVHAAQNLNPQIIPRLEHLLGDASGDVRLQVALALGELSDADAFDLIVLQLRIEQDPAVKKALIKTLASVDKRRSAPILQNLLNDPSDSVVGAATDALKSIAPTLQATPPAVQSLFQALLQTLNTRTGPPGQPIAAPGVAELRARLLRAIAATVNRNNSHELIVLFRTFLTPGEAPIVREAALAGLGLTGEDAGGTISAYLNPNDEPDPEVRREAANALGVIGSSNWARRLDESSRLPSEPSRIVQDAAWQAFQKILLAGSAGDLVDWAEQFKSKKEYDRQLFALIAACKKLKDNPLTLAAEQQTVGDIYAHELNKPVEAIPYYRDALAYYEDQKQSQRTLMKSLLKAYLATSQVDEAIKFSREQLQFERSNVQEIGPELANTAETLKDSPDPAQRERARDLINKSLTLDLEDFDKYRLRSFLKDIPAPPATRAAR